MSEQAEALEDLRIIRRMIEQTRRSTGLLWMDLLQWGVLGVFASVASHVLLVTQHEHAIWLVWGIYLAVGTVLNLLLRRHETRRTRVRTFVERTLAMSWTAIAVTIVLVSLASFVAGAIPGMFIPGIIALLLGAGVFITAALVEWRPLYLAASLWWAGGLLMMMRPGAAFLFHGVLLLLGFVLPGYLLRRHLRELDAHDAEAA